MNTDKLLLHLNSLKDSNGVCLTALTYKDCAEINCPFLTDKYDECLPYIIRANIDKEIKIHKKQVLLNTL